MAGSVNKAILVGNVGNDPEIRTFGNGGKVANLSLATSESWKDKTTGDKRSKTEWHRVAIFNDGLVGIVERYVKKGSKLYIEGKLQTRKWQDRDGNDNYTTEVVLQGFGGKIVLLDSRNSDGGGSSGYSSDGRRSEQNNYAGGNSQSGGGAAAYDDDDEIPF